MSDLIGKTIGQYQIVELIQETSSALIYKGFQPNMNRYVAVNVLKSQDPAALQAFRQQNELLAQIQHPNILPIYDSGQGEGQLYRVMAFAEGGVLQERIVQYYDPGEAAGLLSGLVAGLEQIRDRGAHRRRNLDKPIATQTIDSKKAISLFSAQPHGFLALDFIL